jgi:hypothetical protein
MADAPNPTIFEQAWSYQIAGVPVVQLLIVAGIVYLFYLVIFKRGTKAPVYKKREWKKEVKEYNYEDLSLSFPINMVFYHWGPQRFIMDATIHKGQAVIEHDYKNPKKIVIKFNNTDKVCWKLRTRNFASDIQAIVMARLWDKVYSHR